MVNLFSGIISPAFKQLYTDAISSLFYDDACTVPCTISYGTTRYESCVNCVFDAVGQKSANKFQDGGPIPFPFGGICPMCNGDGKRAVETTEDINLMVVWDTKQFMNASTVNIAEGTIQTITFMKNAPKLKRAKEIIVATDLEKYSRFRYVRISDPQPCAGLGTNDLIECMWSKSG